MTQAGIGQALLAELRRLPASDHVRLTSLLDRINEALDQSPAPAQEWRSLQDSLGLELLAHLLGISQSSARRYLAGSRTTPDAVAVRLHFLAFVVGHLAGAYNDIGVRRWFERKRTQLGGNAPVHLLGDEWAPEEDGPRHVLELARSLTSSPAT